ncbi:MAG: hypothetical protein JWO92_1469 [Chitinophagaceae bacterium]|nr:hypothetical protein [Chitinophagaceae bacterium]
MKTFKNISQIEVSSAEFSFSINEYKFYEFDSEPDIIASFFKDEFYKREDFSRSMRAAIQFYKEDINSYLKPAFNLKKIGVDDFHKLSKSEALEFIWNNISIWQERKIEEETILFEKVKLFLNASEVENYYVISKDFFDQTLDEKHNPISEKIVFDATIYGYYFIVTWVEIPKNIITVSQFEYD